MKKLIKMYSNLFLYKNIIEQFLGKGKIVNNSSGDGYYYMVDGSNVSYQIEQSSNKMVMRSIFDEDEQVIKYLEIRFPDDEQDELRVDKTIIDKTPDKGWFIEKDSEFYKVDDLMRKRQLHRLQVYRYAIRKEVVEKREVDELDQRDLEKYSSYRSSFVVNGPIATNKMVSVYCNGADISNLYRLRMGENKVKRAYDLYMGIISKENFADVMDIASNDNKINSWDLHTKLGIKTMEDRICGESKLRWHTNQDKNFLRKITSDYFRKNGYVDGTSEEMMEKLNLKKKK